MCKILEIFKILNIFSTGHFHEALFKLDWMLQVVRRFDFITGQLLEFGVEFAHAVFGQQEKQMQAQHLFGVGALVHAAVAEILVVRLQLNPGRKEGRGFWGIA